MCQFITIIHDMSDSRLRLEKLYSIEDGGQTDRVTALPRPFALDIGMAKIAGVDVAGVDND